jgi:hypothetical protein
MNINNIIEYVAKNYNLQPKMLLSTSKKPYISEPRWVLIHILANYKRLPNKIIQKELNINKSRIDVAMKGMKKKFEDIDFKEFYHYLLDGMEENADISHFMMRRDLKEFKKWCTEKGVCLVAPYMKIVDTSFAHKYNVSTANQLYYLLTHGEYAANREDFHKMKPMCSTKNCVVHWKAEEGPKFYGVQTPAVVEEEESDTSPEEKLVYAVINSAIEEKDEKFFRKGYFKRYLQLLSINNYNKILDKFPAWCQDILKEGNI